MRGGVYVYRARKPGARLRIPLLSWHFAYVGETSSFHHRHLQHTEGGGTYRAVAKPWADRSPYVVLRIPLPNWRWARLLVETLLIALVWPAYNVQKNRWNPRRITPRAAARQRAQRDVHGWSLNFTRWHWVWIMGGAAWLLYVVLR